MRQKTYGRLISKITGKGQIGIPKEVRQALGAELGDNVEFEITESKVTIRRLEPLDTALHSALSKGEDKKIKR